MDVRRRMLFKKKASSSGATGGSYTVNLNSQWEATTAVPNPDSTLYDGVYRSASNYNVNGDVAIMYITIKDCNSFKMYIRSYAESNYDYVMVSQLDQTINGGTSYSNTKVKAHTRGNQLSGTALSNYTLVEFTGISAGEHVITVVYRKDGSAHNGDDRGYVLIEKMLGSNEEDEEDIIPEPIINIDNYLTIEALEDGLTASLSKNACEYCIDGDGNWKTLSAGTTTENINIGHTVSFRGELTPTASNGIGTFTISKKCNLKGNCMSMLFGDNAVNNYSLSGKKHAFMGLFKNCKTITNAKNLILPATTLAFNCYKNMFYYCTKLTTAPELPATTLDLDCYSQMFQDCTSLTTAPELPATTLKIECYQSMFSGCTSLTSAPELPATTLAALCYQSMFRNCISLTTAPKLPATTLIIDCYNDMFYGTNVLPDCSNIDFTKHNNGGLGGLFSGTKVTDNDLYNILPINPDTGNYWLPATTLTRFCYYGMFSDCTSLTTAPELPATTLAYCCYYYMFEGCSKLNYIKMLATDISATDCLHYWVSGVASTGTFIKHKDMTSLPTGTSGIPSGWTVVDSV